MTFDRRVRAYSIDMSFSFILMAASIIALMGVESIGNLGKWLITFFCYFGVFIIPHFFSRGQTFGKRIQKIKVVKKTDNLVPNEYIVPPLYILILREVFKGALSLFTFGFYLVVAGIVSTNRQDGRTIHDLIFGTRVIALTKYSDNQFEIKRSEFVSRSLRGSSYDD